MGTCDVLLRSNRSHSFTVLAYYVNLVDGERPGTESVWNKAAIEFVMMVLVRFLHDYEQGVVGSLCYDHRWVKVAGTRSSHLFLAFSRS